MHWNGKVVRTTVLIVTGDVEGKLQSPQRRRAVTLTTFSCLCTFVKSDYCHLSQWGRVPPHCWSNWWLHLLIFAGCGEHSNENVILTKFPSLAVLEVAIFILTILVSTDTAWQWRVKCWVPSHYRITWNNAVRWTLKNKFQWNSNQNTKHFILVDSFWNIFCKIAVILSLTIPMW